MLETYWDAGRILATVVAGFLLLVLLRRWPMSVRTTLEPWETEGDKALSEPDAIQVCHRCFTEQPELPGWFCPNCGSAVGPHNNWMGYVYIFSIGEILSTGAFRRFSVSPITVTGFFLFSAIQYTVFAPIYWFWLIRNIRRLRREMISQT